MFGKIGTGAFDALQNEFDDIVDARLFHIGHNNFLGIGSRFVTGLAEKLLGDPEAEQFVTASAGLEAKLGVMREFCFFTFLAFVET